MRSNWSARKCRRWRREAGGGPVRMASVKRVYSASDLVDARLLADSLADECIRTHLFNASAVGAMGDVPFGEAWPEVWIADERDLSRAREVVAAHAARQPSGGSLRCSGCGEESPSNFGCCWNCGMDVGAGSQPASAAGCVR